MYRLNTISYYELTLSISAPGVVSGTGQVKPKAEEAKAKTTKRVAIIFIVLVKD